VCASHALGLMLLPTTGAPADVDRVAEAAVDGFVVWTTADDDPVVDAVAATGLPAAVHGGPRREGLSFVAIDDLAAARAVAAEVFATARRPAVLSFPLDRARTPGIRRGPSPEEATFRVTRQRLRGLRDAWQDLGGDWSRVQVVICAINDAAEGERRAAELLSGPDAPDAVAAMSDELAFGVLRAAAHLGRRVPGDLTVTGWDDSGEAGPAGLTTIAQSLRDQGAHCARLALGETPGHPYKPDWTLIRRESTRGVPG
jgi:DNA-binding LacI/PurR family transcriptional regulator